MAQQSVYVAIFLPDPADGVPANPEMIAIDTSVTSVRNDLVAEMNARCAVVSLDADNKTARGGKGIVFQGEITI